MVNLEESKRIGRTEEENEEIDKENEEKIKGIAEENVVVVEKVVEKNAEKDKEVVGKIREIVEENAIEIVANAVENLINDV